jgi:hypothetical protein
VFTSAGSKTSVIFDVDGDGDLDIVTNEFNDYPLVLINDLNTKKTVNFVQVKLIGTSSNRTGLGARVTVNTTSSYTKWQDGKSGYLGQSDMPLYFGLGDDPVIQSIEVLWPSGIRQVITQGLESGKLIKIQEKAGDRFHRADPNVSGTTDLADAVSIFGYLFLGSDSLTCLESADVNNSGVINISDGIAILNWLFASGEEPAAPGPSTAPCGFDPDPTGSEGDLGCESYAPCR